MVAFVLSLILAAAALLLGIGVADSGLAGVAYRVADVASGPFEGVVSFSGKGADLKNAFATYGLGALLYLVIAFAMTSIIQSLRSRTARTS